MFGYSKEKLICFIEDIYEEIAFITLTDSVGEKSTMEIPLQDLKDNDIECEIGTFFSFTLKCLWGMGEMYSCSDKKKIFTKEEIERTRKYYEEKYRDI